MKRRLLAIFLSLTMIFTLVPTAWAEGSETGTASVPELTNPATSGTSGGIDWKVENGLLTVSAASSPEGGYSAGQMKDYTSQAGETVADPTGWYALKDSITEIKIEEGVTGLGNWAFSYLTNVVKANIPASITSLGNHIFRGDTALTTVEWASGFNAPEIIDTDSKDKNYSGKYVPTSMFDGCTSLGNGKELSAWLPASFTGVGCAAFRGTQFTVDFDNWNNLTYIGAYGFAGMPNLDSFTLSNEITLGLRGGASNAFNNSGLKSLTVADGIAVVPSGLCNGCDQLSSVALADSVTTITMYAFFNTKALKKIDLKNVRTIDGYAFWGSGLTDLVLPGSVKNVGSRAFEACTSLTKVTINAADLTLENNNTFAGCNSLNTVVTSADSKINELNNSAFGPDTTYGSKDYGQAPVESIEINGTVNALNFSALSSLKSLTINGQNTWLGNALPSRFENLVINGDSWSVGGYQFQGSAPVKHLTVFADNVSAADKSEAAFRSNSNLETAQFTGTTVKLQAKMFMGCTKLNWLDLSTVGDLTVGSSCFGDDTSKNYGASTEKPNKFNEDCVIYAKDAAAAQTLRGSGSGLDKKGIVLIVNGGTVDVTAATAGFGAVSCAGYTAQWYDNETCTGSPVTGNPVTGKTYYANWTKSASVALTSNPAADADGKVSATYTPSGAVTLSVQNPGADWLYVWMKDNQPIDGNESSLTLSSPSQSGEYTVKVVAGGTGTDVWTSNAINVTITKATVANTAKENVHHTFGTTYDVRNLFNIDPNAGEATYALAENTDENAGAATLEGNILTITKAGTIKVSLTTAGTDNYNAGSAVTATLIVDKAAPTIDITAESTSLVGGGTVKLTVSGVPEGGTVTVTQTDDRGSAAKTLDLTANGEISVCLSNTTAKYTFTVVYAGDDNYNGDNASCEVSVTRRHTSSVTPGNTVSVPSTPNGTVTVTPSNASKGTNVTVTVKPNEGYELGSLAVKDASGNLLPIADLGNGKFSFVMPASKVSVEAEFVKTAATSFADVPANAYFADAVKWAVDKGITNGLSDTMFGPYESCTRAQIVTFLWRAAGSPEPKTASSFTDVPASAYYAKAVAWAVENGITNGMTETTFAPDATCTRGQSVTFLYRALKGTASGSTNFTDVKSDAFYADAINWAVANNVTNGTSNTTFSPNADCTRAEIVTFLYRAYQGK